MRQPSKRAFYERHCKPPLNFHRPYRRTTLLSLAAPGIRLQYTREESVAANQPARFLKANYIRFRQRENRRRVSGALRGVTRDKPSNWGFRRSWQDYGAPRTGWRFAVRACCSRTLRAAACRSAAASRRLRAIRDEAAQLTDAPVGYCLDTCHLLAAGYDVSSATGLRESIEQADRVLGIDNVKLIHANDSEKPLGAHADRHANIGEGHIGKAGFRRMLAHPMLRSRPFILETPVERDGDDRRNLENLKKLCPKSRTTTTRSS